MRNATRWTRSGIRSLDRILLSHTGLQSLFTKLILQATWIWRSWDSYYLLSIWVNNLWKRYCRSNSIKNSYFISMHSQYWSKGSDYQLNCVVPSLLCDNRYGSLPCWNNLQNSWRTDLFSFIRIKFLLSWCYPWWQWSWYAVSLHIHIVWLIDCLVFYAVSAIFQPLNGCIVGLSLISNILVFDF